MMKHTKTLSGIKKEQAGKSMRIFYFLFFIFYFLSFNNLHAVSVVAVVNGNPITDADITDRVKIMPAKLNNRDRAKEAIIDDYIKLEYARQFKIEPSEKDVAEAVKEHADNPQMRLSARAALAWQMMIMKTIVPMISVSDADIKNEMNDLERERGLPIEITFIRLTDVPEESYAALERPDDCGAAESMARKLGGDPQKITALEYELAPEVRGVLVGRPELEWSPLSGKNTYLICGKKKTDEWGRLDEIIRQNAVYKRALFQADQILKQQRRKTAVTK
jgi:hypothetical protein